MASREKRMNGTQCSDDGKVPARGDAVRSDACAGAANVLADIAAGEEPIPMTELPGHPAVPKRRGHRPHISACFRWASRGLRGYRLESARVFGVISTTPSAIARFNARLNGVAPTATTRTPARRARELARAEQELLASGL